MRDPDILQSFTDDKLGIHFEQVRTSEDVRAEFPWMPETRWGAWPVNESITQMCVGATSGAALAKLLSKYPELIERRAA